MPSVAGTARRGAAGALLGVVIAIVVIDQRRFAGSSKGASPSDRVAGATTVQYRNLVATDTESGTLSYANPQTVYNRLSGTITWLPQVGAVIKPGRHAVRRRQRSGGAVRRVDARLPRPGSRPTPTGLTSSS